MKLKESTLSPNGLTTVPPAVRNALDLKQGDKIAWHIEHSEIVIRKGGKHMCDHIFYVDPTQSGYKEENDYQYPLGDQCIFCGATEKLERAHLDYEDQRHNYVTACRPCHKYADAHPVNLLLEKEKCQC